MDRHQVAALPVWERAALLSFGDALLGRGEGGEGGGPSEADILSTPGIGW